MKNSIQKQAVMTVTILLGLAASASAGFVPIFLSNSSTATNSTFNYNFVFSSNASSGSAESLTAGDFLSLYDVGSFNAVGISPVGPFSNTQSLVGVTAPFTAPLDSASILNLTSTYAGLTLTGDATFNVSITFPGVLAPTLGFYSSTDTIASGKNSQAGRVTVPLINPVPEPSTFAALAFGGGLLAAALRRRRTAKI